MLPTLFPTQQPWKYPGGTAFLSFHVLLTNVGASLLQSRAHRHLHQRGPALTRRLSAKQDVPSAS